MALLWHSDEDELAEWRPVLERLIPGLDLRVSPGDLGEVEDIDAALVYRPPPGLLASLPNLKAVFSISAGVDALLADRSLPDVPVCRMMDVSLVQGMREYVLFHAIKYHRLMDVYRAEQALGVWNWRRPLRPDQRTVGVMGLGNIGAAVAGTLRGHGFRTLGWSRSEKALDGIETFAGEEGLRPFLAGLDVLVCLLPLTAETEGVLNADLFARMPRGAKLIHVGRGPQVNVDDLVAALDEGQLGHATLDVFPTEPLPPESPLWRHASVDVTPHVASGTDPETASAFVAENHARLRAGRELLGVVDRSRGY